MAIENIRFLLLTEVICYYTTLKVPGVGFSVAGPDRAKFGFYRFQSFFVYCCHSDIDFY